MRRPSGLDRMVHNFQHNWETSPQFRALWSGGFGLTIVVLMCACLGFAFTFAGTAAARLAGVNTTSNPGIFPSGTPHGCSGDCNVTFPTPTVPSWAPPLIPQGQPIPPSLTPAPTPTAMPTATPVPTSAPPPPCNNNCPPPTSAGTVSITSTNPSPLHVGSGSIVIHTSQPSVPIEVNIIYPGGAFNPGGGTVYTTDGGGNYTLSVNVPSGDCTNGSNSTINFWITAQFPGGTVSSTISEHCA